VTIDARRARARYVGAMTLGPFLRRHGVDAFVVLLAALWQVENWVDGRGSAAVAAAFLGTLPLLLRRRFPFAAPVLVFAGLTGISLANPAAAADGEVLTEFAAVSLALAFWFAGAHQKAEQAIAGTAIGLASVAAVGRSAGAEFVVFENADSDLGIIGVQLLAGALSLAAFTLRRRAQAARELEARAVAEASRETVWEQPSFVKELFLGRLVLDLVHPHPQPDAEEQRRGQEFLGRLERFLRDEVDPERIEREARIPEATIQRLRELGAFGIKIPREYDGLGLSQYTYGRAMALIGTAIGGIPVSTTQTIAGSIMGVGAIQRFSAVRWGVAGKIVYAWILTIPMAAAIGALAYGILSAFKP